MAIEVVANLRIPGLTIKSPTEPPQAVNNTGKRFIKPIILPSVPKAGDAIRVTVRPNLVFDCAVTRSEWSDERGQFIVSCTLANRSISVDDYHALVADPEWMLTNLP